MRTLSLVAAAGLASLPLAAREYSPRVVSPHVADTYSLKTFADFPRWRDLRGDAKAWEIYRYLADTRTGLFHMNEVLEGEDTLSEHRTVRDPVKIINVYGYGYCGILGPVMAGVCEGVGLGPARTLSLPGWRHVASEVFYDDAWHYLDIDVRAVFRRADGRLASLDDARREDALWTGRGPLFFPNDPLDKTRETYRTTEVHTFYGYHGGSHCMDFVLRQGETFTRWWTPQGGRWHHADRYNRSEWLTRLLEGPPRGPKPNHRHFTIHNHGNGRFVYAPDLTDRSTDVRDGAYDADNVRPSPEGLTLQRPGRGTVVFAVHTPYIIVPAAGDTSRRDDDHGASVVELDAPGASLAVSLDNGLTWRDAPSGPPGRAVDLTPLVAGTYGYLLRLSLDGQPGVAMIRSLRLTTWVQVAPASLPALGPGTNRLEYRAGDHYGLATRVVRISPDAGRPEEFLRVLSEAPTDYDPKRRTGRVRGRFVARVDAPPHTRIAWLSLGASFRTHQREAAARTANRIEYAVGGPEGFVLVYEADIPTDCNHWHTNAEREVRLPTPAETVFVRYTGNPALNNIRIAAHCLEAAPRPSSRIEVTHAWRDHGEPRQETVALRGPGTYTIDAGKEPVNESVTIAVPSDGPRKAAQAPSPAPAGPASPGLPDWVAPMRAVHARYTGEHGTFAQFGDSITDSRAFWSPLRWKRDGAPPQMQADFELVNGTMQQDCWDRKGPQYGNQGGRTIRWARQHIDAWLGRLHPEAAILMFGTNDLNNMPASEYARLTREVVQACLDNGTVVILSTIPPRHRFEQKATQFAEAARALARDLHVPLVDFHAEILQRRPDDWNGVLDAFAGHTGYDVPTLIARDGVHPSNPKRFQACYTEEALRCNGFSLRNYLVLSAYAQVIRAVLKR